MHRKYRLKVLNNDIRCSRTQNGTSGHLEHGSTKTKRLSPVGNGPHKSMWTVSHGFCGIEDKRMGSGADLGDIDWQERHSLTVCSTSQSMPGQKTFSRRSCFVCTMPWWPLWASWRVRRRNWTGITILRPQEQDHWQQTILNELGGKDKVQA